MSQEKLQDKEEIFEEIFKERSYWNSEIGNDEPPGWGREKESEKYFKERQEEWKT